MGLDTELTGLVVHCKKSPYDVYIGRPSKWGNPFVVGKDGSREEVIDKYEQYIMSDPELLSAAKAELKGKVLGCWCDPLPCHGHVLARLARGLDPVEEAENARRVVNMISGREAHWEVILKIRSVAGYPPATGNIFMGTIPHCSVEEAKTECRRRWPRQYKGGLTLKYRPATRPNAVMD